MKTAMTFVLSAMCLNSATALEIVEKTKITEVGPASVVEIDGGTYAITDIPTRAPMIEVSLTPPAIARDTSLTAGCKVDETEALKAINEWYRAYSFDFSSLQLRNMQVGEPSYVVWCDSPIFFTCANWQMRAGTWVEFEINGKNRQGGMAGFSRTIKLIRKSPRGESCDM